MCVCACGGGRGDVFPSVGSKILPLMAGGRWGLVTGGLAANTWCQVKG